MKLSRFQGDLFCTLTSQKFVHVRVAELEGAAGCGPKGLWWKPFMGCRLPRGRGGCASMQVISTFTQVPTYCRGVQTAKQFAVRVTIRFTFRAHSVFMCFVWIWEQTAIISLYNINWLVFITETQCVYCAVRTGYLYIIQVSFSGL